MTYCLAIALEEGLIFCSDSRTNAGPDQVTSYSKMHRFSFPGERKLFLLTAGNLATTQAVITQLHRDTEQNLQPLIRTSNYVGDIADYIGSLLVLEKNKYSDTSGPDAGIDAGATFILGGQIMGQPPELYLIYPEGNFIEASEDQSFFQIGETKYGKPIIVRALEKDSNFGDAIKLLLVSFDCTMKANVSVGMPIDVCTLKKDDFQFNNQIRIEKNDPYFEKISNSWGEALKKSIKKLPPFDFK